ncbi:adhesion G protein-coupled receptor L3-like isoform X2 [Antedon mediterranea]|uniref:adhesion G protein-coupled receptor L3-like isoform X2 n=1 Tax=Antedon mediterranea TaxID=105859 RepID=UPI003AF81FA0
MKSLKLAILVAVFTVTSAVRNTDNFPSDQDAITCPESWKLFEGKCFALFEDRTTWFEAEKKCINYGADLAILNTEKRNQMAINMTDGKNMFIWIGLTDLEVERTFVWNDGRNLGSDDYSPWGNVEPNNRGTNFQTPADCVLLHVSNNIGQWKDKNCEESLFYMCMRNLTVGTTTYTSTSISTTIPDTTVKQDTENRLNDLTSLASRGNLSAAEVTSVGESAMDAVQVGFNSPTSDDTDKMEITQQAESLFVVLSESVEIGESLVISKDNIVAELHHLSSPEDLQGLRFNAPGYNATNSTPPSLIFEKNKEGIAEGTDVNVAVVYYDRKLFESGNSAKENSMDPTMISGVISATASSKRNKLPVSVNFTLPIDNVPNSWNDSYIMETVCAFWNVAASDWSTDGCYAVMSGSDGSSSADTTCFCSHTTNFAVLMQVSDVPIDGKHEAALGWITRIGCSISLAGLFISLAVYMYLEDLRKLERNLIHINLMVSLIVVQLLFLLGIERTENEDWCTAIAICLHFFLMAVFSWMLVEGIYLHFKLLRRTAVNKSKLPYYILIGWGIPVITVAFTVGFALDGYGSDKSCWLTTVGGHIWAFVGPALAIILVNIITLFFVVKLIFQRSSRRKNESQHAVTAVKGAFILLPILGLTWLFGILSVDSKTTMLFQYLFVIFNSLQGLSIFLVYCVLNTEVQNAWKRQRDRKKRTSLMTSLSKEVILRVSQRRMLIVHYSKMKKGSRSTSSTTGQSAPLKQMDSSKEFV